MSEGSRFSREEKKIIEDGNKVRLVSEDYVKTHTEDKKMLNKKKTAAQGKEGRQGKDRKSSGRVRFRAWAIGS